jgi:uncharacterized OB-fold protein
MTEIPTARPLPAPPPIINVETRAFWDATKEGKLLLPRCNACGTVIWYPRAFCPECSSFDVSWFEASGQGTIYSYTLNRRGQGDYRDVAYVLAYVELAEGPRILTNIVECDPASVSVGQAVKVTFQPTSNGAALPRFRPS